MNYSENEIIDALNKSGKLKNVTGIKISDDKFQQGILGNLRKIELKYAEPMSEPSNVIYKNQCCSDKFRELRIYDLLSECCRNHIPQKICDFKNGDIIIENLEPCKSGKTAKGCNIYEAKKILNKIGKIHSFFWDNTDIPNENHIHFAGILKFNLEENLESYFKRYSGYLDKVEQDFKWLLNNTETASMVLHSGKTLTHGDLHLENIMFSKSGEMYFIDWQLAAKRSPAFDISFFLIQNVDSGIREQHENELLEQYYNDLSSNIKNEYSFPRFLLEYRACLTRSMMSSVMMIGNRFAHKKNQMDDADIIANRVIRAVNGLKPVEAIRELLSQSFKADFLIV